MAFIRYALTLSAFRFLLLVSGQTNHMVTVGLKGSFYDPPSLSAGLNDTITFVFAGFIHTVTQSSLADPCLPLPGGFSSGPVGTLGNASAPTKTWNLQITNVSEPIWFFCEITSPTSHCASGMVGVINPPSIDIYDQWVSSAKAVTGTPSPVATQVLTGIGAFASQTPAPPLTPITLSSTSASLSSSSGAPSTSQAPPTPVPAVPDSSPGSKISHLGAIVGGAVGGAVVIVLLIAILLWFYRQKKSKPFPPSPSTDDSNFFRYNPVPVRRPSEAFMEAKQLEGASSAALSSPRVLSPDAALLPIRQGSHYGPPGVSRVMEMNPQPTQLPRTGIERQTSFTTTNMTLSEQPSSINMHALANEVAVLLRAPSAGNPVGQPVVPNPEGPRPRNKRQEGRHEDLPTNRTESPLSPPAYRTTATPDRSSG